MLTAVFSKCGNGSEYNIFLLKFLLDDVVTLLFISTAVLQFHRRLSLEYSISN